MTLAPARLAFHTPGPQSRLDPLAVDLGQIAQLDVAAPRGDSGNSSAQIASGSFHRLRVPESLPAATTRVNLATSSDVRSSYCIAVDDGESRRKASP